jgi:hypothetical protein
LKDRKRSHERMKKGARALTIEAYTLAQRQSKGLIPLGLPVRIRRQNNKALMTCTRSFLILHMVL